ncbi:hypothetical protein TNCV_1024981 [Trichonephila clavipes]|nr:hypothetical protein TNCV_1024981 [Trichonephila clavipes]
MPAFLDKQAQLSTEDANETRLVTSIRWVVVAVNGQLKNWRGSFKQYYPKNHILEIMLKSFVQFLMLSTQQDLTILKTNEC